MVVAEEEEEAAICMYVRDQYDVTELTDCNLCCEDLEYQWACLKIKDTWDTYIANLHRPLNVNVTTAFNIIENMHWGLEHRPWYDIYSCVDENTALDLFYQKLLSIIDNNAPYKQRVA